MGCEQSHESAARGDAITSPAEEQVEPASPLYLTASRMAADGGIVPSLDGLRALSILQVMSAHYVNKALFPGGFGVLVFFVISGFLITRLLFAEAKAAGRISLANFYARRILRLYPAVVVYTIVVCAIFLALKPRAFGALQPLSALFYFTNYLRDFTELHGRVFSMPFNHFWSLSVEEHFYILFPPLFLLGWRRPARLLTVLAAISVLALLLRLIGAALHPEWLTSEHFYERTEFRMDSLAAGVMLACACELPRGRAWLLRLAHPLWFGGALAVVLVCFAIRDVWFRETVRYTLFNISVVACLAGTLFSDRLLWINRILNSNVAAWIGRLSYSLYVWHEVPILLVRIFGLRHMPRPVLWVFEYTLAFGIACLSYYLIERSVLGLRKRFGSRTAIAHEAPDGPAAAMTR